MKKAKILFNLLKEREMKLITFLISILFLAGVSTSLFAANIHANSTPGVQGYDVVSYQSETGPVRGNGHYVSDHEGVTYLFSTKKNMKAFNKNPQKYLPAYGGYCAYGVSVGKKFVGDPTVWKIVDGKLYLNLDENIQKEWEKDIPGRIAMADKEWPKIKDASPASL